MGAHRQRRSPRASLPGYASRSRSIGSGALKCTHALGEPSPRLEGGRRIDDAPAQTMLRILFYLSSRPCLHVYVLPFELRLQVGLGQVAEVLVGQCVEFTLEVRGERPLDLFLPGLLLEPVVGGLPAPLPLHGADPIRDLRAASMYPS